MKFDELKTILSKEHKEYKSIPFWSWNNEIEEEELVKQIEDMHSVGIGGFIMHARTGLKIEYLGEKWFSCIDACLKKAKELNMEAWVYDENGWPSGFVGGKLLKNVAFRAQYLEYKVLEDFDESAFVVYKKVKDEYKVITEKEKNLKAYHTVYLRTSPANTDILNPEVVTAFINETHEQYYKRFKNSFGKELVGFFTDEPQYYRQNTPYSIAVENEYKKKGKDVKEGLIYLFTHDENGYAFRNEYYSTLSYLYVNNFYKRLYDWCAKHNCKLTGHSIEESGLADQLPCCSGVSPSYEFEQMPGIDWLGKFLPDELITKQIGSVSSQLNKKYVLTETFACCGNEVTPKELKSVAEFQEFGGVNRICQHLYPYSVSGQGKFDHPPVFSRHSNWFDGFKIFNNYFEKLGYIVGETKEIYDLAIIHPLNSIYLDYIREEHHESEGVKKLEKDFHELFRFLENNGITYHLIDDTILKNNGKNKKDGLMVGSCKYSTIIVPKMNNIAKSTLDFLMEYKGKLLNLADIKYVDGVKADVSLPSNTTMEEIIAKKKIKFTGLSGRISMTARSGKLGDFIFVKNLENVNPCSFKLENYSEYKALELETLTIKDICETNEINGLESMILVKDDTQIKPIDSIRNIDITKKFAFADITENYLVIDMAKYSFDGKKYSTLQSVQQIFDDLLYKDYKGEVFVKYEFTVKDVVPMKVVCEQSKYKSFTVNGNEVTLSQNSFDLKFFDSDISSFVKEGKNEVVLSFDFYQHDGVHFALFDPESTESLVNCLYYDTSIENIYIKGEFNIDNKYAICSKKLPEKLNNIEKNGYPFFKGEFKICGKYSFDGIGIREMQINGGFLTAKVTANGKSVDLVLDNKKDISSILVKGMNDIEITVKVSLRNLFGPLHYNQFGISPFAFTFRKCWRNGKPDLYVNDFVLVPVGIDSITMKEIR